jgi:hypothetical protein
MPSTLNDEQRQALQTTAIALQDLRRVGLAYILTGVPLASGRTRFIIDFADEDLGALAARELVERT